MDVLPLLVLGALQIVRVQRVPVALPELEGVVDPPLELRLLRVRVHPQRVVAPDVLEVHLRRRHGRGRRGRPLGSRLGVEEVGVALDLGLF